MASVRWHNWGWWLNATILRINVWTSCLHLSPESEHSLGVRHGWLSPRVVLWMSHYCWMRQTYHFSSFQFCFPCIPMRCFFLLFSDFNCTGLPHIMIKYIDFSLTYRYLIIFTVLITKIIWSALHDFSDLQGRSHIHVYQAACASLPVNVLKVPRTFSWP